MKTVLVLAATVFLFGCGNTQPLDITDDIIERCGPMPNQVELEAMQQQLIEHSLKDPYSAHVTHYPLSRASVWMGFGRKYGWLLATSVNAKNSYGAYTGDKMWYLFVLPDGTVNPIFAEQGLMIYK